MSTARAVDCAAHLGLAGACARRFLGRGIPYEELYQQACAALAQAAARFDAARGAAFSTYAVPCILGELKRRCERETPLHVPRTDRDLLRRAECARREALCQTGREPTLSALAETVGASPEALGAALAAQRGMAALRAPDDEAVLRAPDPRGEGFVGYVLLLDAVSRLPPPLPALVRLRFLERRTQTEVARRLRVSQAQASRLERRARALLADALRE